MDEIVIRRVFEIERLNKLPMLSSWIKREYRWQVERMGPPPQPPRPTSEARDIFATVRQGDGKYDEAIAAVMWHCGLSAEEAETSIGDYVRWGRIGS